LKIPNTKNNNKKTKKNLFKKKIPNTKRAGGVAQGVDPEFKPRYQKQKQTNKQTKNLRLLQPLQPFSNPYSKSRICIRAKGSYFIFTGRKRISIHN
jgi:hypothetical protein